MKSTLIVSSLNYGILNDISFSLEKNTLNALIGHSGSGKTTLLKCLAGLCKFGGNITINGNVITKSSKVKERISIFTTTFMELKETPFESILESLESFGMEDKKAKKEVYNISSKLGIDNLLYKNVETLSYSEKKMIGIAKTLVAASDIILLDNVFDSLNLNYKNKVINYLKGIKGSIIIFTTNNAEDLMLVDNIIIMNEGKVVEIGNKEDLFKKENAFTKNELELPFIIDLSHKLKVYGLIDHLTYKSEDMVNELWK